MTWAATGTTARTRIVTALTGAGVTKVALGNAKLATAPAPSDTWARVTIREVDSRHFAFGTPRTFEDVAIASVELFTPVGGGEGPLRTIADTLRTALPAATVSGVQFGIPRLVGVGPDDAWYRGVFLIDLASFHTA